jgi:hypothetical protein
MKERIEQLELQVDCLLQVLIDANLLTMDEWNVVLEEGPGGYQYRAEDPRC